MEGGGKAAKNFILRGCREEGSYRIFSSRKSLTLTLLGIIEGVSEKVFLVFFGALFF